MTAFRQFNNASNPGILDRNNDDVIEIDSLKTAEDQLIETLEKTYTSDKLAKQTKYNAVVLLHFEDSSPSANAADLFSVKARIPELHSLIPTPGFSGDFASILLHPTFVGSKKILRTEAEVLSPGTRITVTFGNMNDFTEPQVLSIQERGP